MSNSTIVEAIRKHGLPSGNERVYRATVNDKIRYVVSTSLSKAALSVVSVERVSDKDVNNALAAAIVSVMESHPEKNENGGGDA